MQNFSDYIFIPDVWMITDNGSFIGTRNHLFCIPSKKEEHAYRSITTTRFSLKGKSVPEAIAELIQSTRNVRELEEALIDLKKEFDALIHFDLNEIGAFKVQAGFLGSGIHVKEGQGKFGYRPFIQRLGKRKKEVKEFYQGHGKLA
jgi:hypothetical protein